MAMGNSSLSAITVLLLNMFELSDPVVRENGRIFTSIHIDVSGTENCFSGRGLVRAHAFSGQQHKKAESKRLHDMIAGPRSFPSRFADYQSLHAS